MYTGEDPYEDYVPVRVFFDEPSRKWKCRCFTYEKYGSCTHLTPYRRETEVRVLEEYL